MSTISIQCTHCHKRYNAPATMAGKKVKCKHCGKIFEIPADELGVAEDDAPMTGVPAPFKAVQKGATAAPPADNDDEPVKAPAGGKLGQASAGFRKKIARKEDTDEIDFAQTAAPMVMLRPSIPHDFPGAAALDQWGPLLLALIGLGLLAAMAMSSNTTGQDWVGTARLGAYLFLCLGIAFPLGFVALRIAAGKCRLMLPPMAAVRALGTFSFGFAVALILWLSGGSVTMLVVGAILGAGLVCAAVWFFFRVQAQEMSTMLGSAALALVGSVVISYLAMLAANAIFASSARSLGSNLLASSPMGPTFDWDVPVSDGTKSPKPNNTKIAVNIPDVPGTTAPTTTTAPVVDPHPATSQTTVAVTPHVDPHPPNATTAPAPTTTTTTATTQIVKPPVNPVVVTPAVELSPLVAKISTVADLGEYGQVVFPTGSGTGAVAIKRGETEDSLAFYSGSPLAMKGETKFDVEKEVSQKYCVSPSGETLARLTTFPKLGVLLWSTSSNKEFKVAPLNPERGKPELLGFGVNDNIVILWSNGGFIDVEAINIKANPPATVVGLRLKMFDRSASNPAISSDGRQLAVATFFDRKGGLDLWDLTSNRRAELRTCFVPIGNWQLPTGITYSSNSQQLSAYFEQGTKGVIYSFRTGDAGQVHEFAYRTLPYPAGAAEAFNGRTLDYIDANDWLLMGRAIIDIESGKPLGDLQIENVKSQRVVDKETLLLHVQTPEGKNQLLEVKLKTDAIAAKRLEVRGTKPPKTP